MAQMFPSRFPLPDEPGRWAELQVYRAFQELDDDWMVFYSVPWQSIRKGRQGDGEADFVLVHGRFGIFVVEVKGGSRIELRDGGWFTWSQGTPKEIKNPFEQAKESKYALLNYLSDRMADLPKGITLGHFVVFPSHQQEGDLGPDGLRSIVCDKEDLRDINSTLSKITSHWNSSKPSSHLKPSHLKTIKQSLAPTVSLKRALRYQIEDIGDELNSLTDRQIEAMRILRRQRRTIVVGAAGTGKTVLAMARARQLALDGFKTLFVCFNRPLGERLSAEMAKEQMITAGSFHSICRDLAERAEMLPPGPIDGRWWDEALPETLSESTYTLGRQFDAIVIDEGQDFHPEWWDYLELSLVDPGEGILAVFADSNQDIYRGDWRSPFEAEPVVLDINCRNTIEIAERTNCLLDFEQSTLGVSGIKPLFKEASTQNQFEKQLKSSVKKFLREDHLKANQVVILTTRREEVDQFIGTHLEDIKLGDGTNNSVLFETVHRFKGLESDAIILLLHDQDPSELKRLAYVGMSRARVVLHVIGSARTEALLEWPS